MDNNLYHNFLQYLSLKSIKIIFKSVLLIKKVFMKEENLPIESQEGDLDINPIENSNEILENQSSQNESSKWVDNQGAEVKNVFGFNSSAELVNGRAAMIGFIMLLLTELVFKGRPVTSSIFGIN